MDLLLFGDQTSNSLSFLRQAAASRETSISDVFLTQVSSLLRAEIERLPYDCRSQIPQYVKILDLIASYQEHDLKIPELEAAFLTISQIAWYIKYCENNPQESVSRWRCVAICTGSLAAAAIASSVSLHDLTILGVEAVKVAFRAGTCASIIGHAEEESSCSWSTLITDISAETVQISLDEFHANASVPKSRQAYVSCIGPNSVTISGPPSVTRSLFKTSSELKSNTRMILPVYAPYHARHLFQQEDIKGILDDETLAVLKRFRSTGEVYSTVTGRCHESSDTAELFAILLDDMLCKPVKWKQVIEAITIDYSADSKTCRLLAVGQNAFSSGLISSLKASGVDVTSLDNPRNLSGTEGLKLSESQSNKIAIVGMAGRFPNAANHEQLWELLIQGLDVHKEIPKDRFDAHAHYDPSGKEKNISHTPYGCLIDEPGLFDPRFFNMSPREAAQTDPMARLALVTAYEALEMSGFTPNRTPSSQLNRIGTFYGQTSDDWREINAAENIDTYFITGGVRAFAPGRINYYFKFGGPSYSIDTAYSSSLAAIQLACTSILAGECDTACAGGVNILTNPDIFAGLSKGQFLSKNGPCKTFDNDADGYCRADGCGTLVLKRYTDAVADNDNILGCILASATNHSADAISITHPHAGAQESLYKQVLATANVSPDDVTYCELHGTGTQSGDHIEMESITNVFASEITPRRPTNTLYLGSLKANIGHGGAASGFSAMVKCLLMLRDDTIPQNVGIKGIINQTFPPDLQARNVNIPLKNVHWPKSQQKKRTIMVNNFSAAGGNTAVILQEAQNPPVSTMPDPRDAHVVSVSARSRGALKRNLANLIAYIDEHPQTHLSSLSYTSTARRMQHNYRISVSVTSLAKAREALLARVNDEHQPMTVTGAKVVLAFTGQGTKYSGLANSLYTTLPSFKTSIDRLNRFAQTEGLPSFLPLITENNISQLSPIILQVGLACIQISLAKMWESWGIKPTAVIGHSLGEYAALHIAGVISANDMVRLVGRRAQLIVDHCSPSSHGMLAVKANKETIRDVLGVHMLEIACNNGPSETVLCGTVEALEATAKKLARSGLKCTLLNVPYVFHSAQIDPILDGFQDFASRIEFRKPEIPFCSTVTGKVISTSKHVGPEYLTRHARQTVNFTGALHSVVVDGLVDGKTVWLEVGAHPILAAMIKATLDWAPRVFPSLKKTESAWQTISSSICGLHENWSKHQFQRVSFRVQKFSAPCGSPHICFRQQNLLARLSQQLVSY
ncbi:hypothetical protein ONS96_013530 [Cadophora gregata f. sp. sojae]|nr:hypothetical protein ONS96_013530 [Cadophora gregata f. sp. sojae]